MSLLFSGSHPSPISIFHSTGHDEGPAFQCKGIWRQKWFQVLVVMNVHIVCEGRKVFLRNGVSSAQLAC